MNLSGEIIESIVLNWNIKINQQDDWWSITSGSPLSGTLDTGEYDIVNVQVDRSGKDEGEYEGSFVVKSSGTNYSYDVEVSLIMEVGEPSVQLNFATTADVNFSGKSHTNNCSDIFTQNFAIDSSELDTTGFYEIIKLQKGHNYTVAPSKMRDSSATAITMYDASLVAQIAVRLFQNPTESQSIAADVDKNGIVSAHDAALIAWHAVELPPIPESHVGEWLFQPDSSFYSPLDSSETSEDYTAILLGDADGSWTPDSSSTENQIAKYQAVELANMWHTRDEQLILPIENFTGKEIYSFRIVMNYDSRILKFKTLSFDT